MKKIDTPEHVISEIGISYRPSFVCDTKISTSNTAYEVLLKSWNKDTINLFEEFKVMLLNNSNQIIGIYTNSQGGMVGTIVDVRLLFGTALKCAAKSIITAHNHPSGKLTPSTADIDIFKKIKKAAEILDIAYLDNLIITEQGQYSFADNAYLR